MTCLPDPGEVLASQKHLQGQLLDRHGAISWRLGRELIAQILLRLDEPYSCWDFPRVDTSRMDVERVDGGYGSPSASTDALGSAKARRPDRTLTSTSLAHRLRATHDRNQERQVQRSRQFVELQYRFEPIRSDGALVSGPSPTSGHGGGSSHDLWFINGEFERIRLSGAS